MACHLPVFSIANKCFVHSYSCSSLSVFLQLGELTCRKGNDVGELGVRVLISNSTMSDRLWEHTYNGQDGWQFGETTIKHDKNFSVRIIVFVVISLFC